MTKVEPELVGGCKYFLFSSLFGGRWTHFDDHIFQDGLVQPPTIVKDKDVSLLGGTWGCCLQTLFWHILVLLTSRIQNMRFFWDMTHYDETPNPKKAPCWSLRFAMLHSMQISFFGQGVYSWTFFQVATFFLQTDQWWDVGSRMARDLIQLIHN